MAELNNSVILHILFPLSVRASGKVLTETLNIETGCGETISGGGAVKAIV